MKALVRPLFRAANLALYLHENRATAVNAFGSGSSEDRRVHSAELKSLEDELARLRKENEKLAKAKEDAENALTQTNQDLEKKLKATEENLQSTMAASQELAEDKKLLQGALTKMQSKALKHKVAAAEYEHMYQAVGPYSFVNALQQVKFRNPELDIKVKGLWPNYEVV
ncbi:MAG: hypothetical protein Q8765_02515, partial [Sweet potato little leaf phytoplasma]|nr:hypothetical protein [Sweet potato little leaf phytoplasma]